MEHGQIEQQQKLTVHFGSEAVSGRLRARGLGRIYCRMQLRLAAFDWQ
jgi:hypothetical protein